MRFKGFAKHSVLRNHYQSTTHQLLSHYPFAGTSAGTKLSLDRLIHRHLKVVLATASQQIRVITDVMIMMHLWSTSKMTPAYFL
jgi:hypothetical protein